MKPNLIFILIASLLDVLGIGLVVPVLPKLVQELSGTQATQTAYLYGLIVTSYALVQFFSGPILGALSDRFGRRPLLLLAMGAIVAEYFVLALAPSVTLLILGRVITGFLGNILIVSNSYIADISTHENRARNFGLMGAMFGIGFVIGPALGGALGTIDTRLPFWVAACLASLNFIYGFFALPESLKPEHRKPLSWQDTNPFTAIWRLRTYPLVTALAFGYAMLSMGDRGLEGVWVLYTQYRFGWNELANGLTLSLFGLLGALTQGLVLPRVVKRWKEAKTAIVSTLITAVSYALFGLAHEPWLMLVILVPSVLGMMAEPALQSIIAREVKADEQGTVQGALSSIMSLTSIVAPALGTASFGFFTSQNTPWIVPGMPFFICALFSLLGFLGITRALRRVMKQGTISSNNPK